MGKLKFQTAEKRLAGKILSVSIIKKFCIIGTDYPGLRCQGIYMHGSDFLIVRAGFPSP